MIYAEWSGRKIFYQIYGRGEPIIYLPRLMAGSGLNRFLGFGARNPAEEIMVLEDNAFGYGQSRSFTNPEAYQGRELARILNFLEEKK